MDEPAIIKSDHRSVSTKQALLILAGTVTVCGVVAFAYLQWPQIYNFLTTDNTTAVQEGTDETPVIPDNDTNQESRESIIFSAVLDDAEFAVPSVYSFDLASENFQTLIDYPSRSFGGQTLTEELAIAYVTDTIDPDGWQPAIFDRDADMHAALPNVGAYNEAHLAVSPDRYWYAYSFQSQPDADTYRLEEWNVALHNYDTGEVRQLAAAAKPVFFNNGSDLLVLKTDGIYRYNLADETLSLFASEYVNLRIIDGYDVSPDARTLIMTVPDLNTISIQSIAMGNVEGQVDGTAMPIATEVTTVVEPGVSFQYPVFAPDSNSYAVLALSDSDFNEATYSYSDVVVEVRRHSGPSVIGAFTLPGVDPNTVRLEQWEPIK